MIIDKIGSKWIVKVKKNTYIVKKSTRKTKKYDVFDIDGKYILSFGANGYAQFFDKLGAYRKYDNNNKIRRDNYFKRFGSHNNDLNSPKFWSHEILW